MRLSSLVVVVLAIHAANEKPRQEALKLIREIKESLKGEIAPGTTEK